MNSLTTRTVRTNSSAPKASFLARSAARLSRSAAQLSAIAGLVIAPLAGCAEAPTPEPEKLAGSAQAIVRGDVPLAPELLGPREVALLWLYWPTADCETHPDDPPSTTCSGSYHVTTATIAPGATGFELVQGEPPPAFVHGYDTPVAEAIIAELPAGLEAPTIDDIVSVSTEHMIVYVPGELASGRIEAQELGGAPLGAGFHLVRVVHGGPQVEGTSEGGDEVFTSQVGEIVTDERVHLERIQLEDSGYRAPFAPALFL